MIRKNLQFSVGEKEYIQVLIEHVGMTELQAYEHVINHKHIFYFQSLFFFYLDYI